MPPKVQSNSFRNIVLFFSVTVLIFIVLTSLLVLPRAELVISTTPEQQSTTLNITLSQNLPPNLQTTFWQKEENIKQTFPITDKSIKKLDFSEGSIKITNTSNTDQVLVANTRFLTSNEILFRLNKRVIVPKQGKITVQASSDKKGPSNNIKKNTKLSIPGLSASRQIQIFGETISDFTGGITYTGKLSQTDVNLARKKLTDELKEKIELNYLAELIKTTVSEKEIGSINTPTILTNIDIIEELNDTQTDTEIEKFEIEIKALATGISFNHKNLEEYLRNKIINNLPEGENMQQIANININLINIDFSNKRAEIKAQINFATLIEDSQRLLETYNLTGLTPEELEDFFTKTPTLELRSIKLSPFWVKRIPSNLSQIKIKITK